MEENKKQSAEQKMEDRFGNRLMDYIVAKTYSRHAKLDSKEYIKAIGFEGKTEDEGVAVRQSILNLVVAMTKQIFMMKTSANIIKSSLDILTDKKEGENAI